jgi:hypothetical protein
MALFLFSFDTWRKHCRKSFKLRLHMCFPLFINLYFFVSVKTILKTKTKTKKTIQYRIIPYHNRPSFVLKNSAKATENSIFIKTFGVFSANLSDSAKRTVSYNPRPETGPSRAGSKKARLGLGPGHLGLGRKKPGPSPARPGPEKPAGFLDFFLFCKRISDLEFSSEY